MTQRLDIRARLRGPGGFAMGPGRADLLDAIAQHGSISAAARALGLSYRRAWLLVAAINRAFATPLVVTAQGGASHGGATLTDTGRAALARYRALQAALDAAAAPHLPALEALLAPA